jgi:hypothetical protein
MRKPTRKLSAGHLEFMRAIVQGVDAQASWDRYLRIEGEHGDLRKVKSILAWDPHRVRRRHAKPETARMVLIDADRIRSVREVSSA